jgi:3-deoxy-D-manno-octulosonic-acid transferase
VKRVFYSTLLYLLLPLILGYLLWRSRLEPEYRRRWRERFGFFPAPGPHDLWIHAASLGEVNAVRPLVEAVLAARPRLRLMLTCVTPTGSARLAELFGARASHGYLPLDLPGSVSRFLVRTRPALGVMAEAELWPNLCIGCHRHAVPLLVASGRLSSRSLDRYRALAGRRFMHDVLASVDFVAAQSAGDADRFRQLGLPAERVAVTGNLKYDHPEDAGHAAAARTLRAGWGSTRRVWIAASTHEGEEAIVLEAHAQLLQSFPELLLVLAPRHPQRFDAVARLCHESGLETARRSRGEACMPHTRVLLADTIGELAMLYAAADVAFVGGTLVPVGGHNLLEPAAAGLPVITGPHLGSQQPMAGLLQSAGAAMLVNDGFGLVERLAELLDSETLRRQAGIAGRHVIAQNRGAVARVLEQVLARLPAEDPRTAAS